MYIIGLFLIKYNCYDCECQAKTLLEILLGILKIMGEMQEENLWISSICGDNLKSKKTPTDRNNFPSVDFYNKLIRRRRTQRMKTKKNVHLVVFRQCGLEKISFGCGSFFVAN